MKLDFSWHILEKYSNIKFHENPSNGTEVISFGQTQPGGWTHVTKLVVTFRKFANARKNGCHYTSYLPYPFVLWYIIKNRDLIKLVSETCLLNTFCNVFIEFVEIYESLA
jgi:hypothetical protein